jgi:hypothetical protein
MSDALPDPVVPPAGEGQTWFGATNGRVTGVIGVIAGAVVVLIGIFQPSAIAVVIGLMIALGTWMVLLRPRVGMRGDELLLRGIVSTLVVPLASLGTVTVRQVLAVWVGERRYVSPAVGHTFREINRQRRDAGQVEEIKVGETKYADHVCDLITERSREARRDGAPTGPVRREWALLELAGAAVLVVALVVVLLVS